MPPPCLGGTRSNARPERNQIQRRLLPRLRRRLADASPLPRSPRRCKGLLLGPHTSRLHQTITLQFSHIPTIHNHKFTKPNAAAVAVAVAVPPSPPSAPRPRPAPSPSPPCIGSSAPPLRQRLLLGSSAPRPRRRRPAPPSPPCIGLPVSSAPPGSGPASASRSPRLLPPCIRGSAASAPSALHPPPGLVGSSRLPACIRLLSDDIPENSEEKTVMGTEKEKERHKSKKEKGCRKEKNNNVNDSVKSGSRKHGVEKEQANNLGLMVAKGCSEHVEVDTSKDNVKKDKKTKKKKEKEAETTGQKEKLHTSSENLPSEYAERDKSEEQSSKSKKIKRKCKDDEPAADSTSGDTIVTSKDKKIRKKDHSVVLEKSSQIDITKMGEKREGKKKRRKESDNVCQKITLNASAEGEEAVVDGNNGKKKKKSKEGIGGGKREKEMAAWSEDKGKRVSFVHSVEVFGLEGGNDKEGDRSGEPELVHGKRFTPEEDATLMEAIMSHIEMKQLGEKGLEMIKASNKHPELRGCWADIAKSLPHRPSTATYHRARILLNRSDERKWTQEEYEKIRRFVENNGSDWKTLAKELGKSAIHVKDTWRRIKPKNMKKGAWTQDEYQNLFDLVNLDLRVKAHQENNPDHRVLRDNISWESISEKLTTRNHKTCCMKWYDQLASPLVKQRIWADTDDYRLMEALQKFDAVCIEDVDWESLLNHRSGEVCRQRWNQMVRTIGGHRERPFIEQVEVLSKRYCPEMLEYRK